MVIDGMVSFVPSSDGTDNENVLICAALGGQGGTLLRTCGVPDLVEKFHGEHLCHSIGAAYAMTAVFFAAKIEEPSTKAIFTGAALGNDIFWSLIAISFGKLPSTALCKYPA